MKKWLIGSFTLALLLGPLAFAFLQGSVSSKAQFTNHSSGSLSEILIPSADAAGGGTRGGRGGGGGGGRGRR